MSTRLNVEHLTKHLDLGCGSKPKNPYNQSRLYGLDVSKINIPKKQKSLIHEIKVCNLIFDQIPYPDNHFDSISAYDFLEHIPRITTIIKNKKHTNRYSFIECMNEIYRVLKNQGKFYAMTPFYPDPSAFIDPTHVNFITDKTHFYFCEPSLGAKIYGFNGRFEIIRVKKVRPKYIYEPNQLNFKQKLRKLNDKFKALESHLVWEFRAIKD